MILIADSGSTKTEWRFISEGKAGKSYISSGLNPYLLSGDDIYCLLQEEMSEISDMPFTKVYFYGTGCNNAEKEGVIKEALTRFLSPEEVFVESDLLAAARSLCMEEKGIACIIGTGSNSCYYDGSSIVSNVSPLGYILGDEGGGAVIGRNLLSGVLKKQLPGYVIDNFYKVYPFTRSEILENVYSKPFPNRFLGQFSKFVSDNIHVPELQAIIISGFDDFIRRNILQYPEAKELPIHFTGSIAFYFRSFLEELIKKHRLHPGKITLKPMDGLVTYHINTLKD
jgi:glucosamine kinase